MDPHITGVYVIAGSVFAEYRRHNDTAFFRLSMISGYFSDAVSNQAEEVEVSPTSSRANIVTLVDYPFPTLEEDNADAFTKELCSSKREGAEDTAWKDLVTLK